MPNRPGNDTSLIEDDETGDIYITQDNRPIFEPGNLRGYAKFEDYYNATVVMPRIHAEQKEFAGLVDILRQKHHQFLVDGDSIAAEVLFLKVRDLIEAASTKK